MRITIHCEIPVDIVLNDDSAHPVYIRSSFELRAFNEEFGKYGVPMSKCFGRYIDKGDIKGNFVGEFEIKTEPCGWGKLSDLFLEWVRMSTLPDLSGVGYAASIQG